LFNATITGWLGNDPEMRYTDGSTPVSNVSIAHNWLYRDERLVKWIRCSILGELAEKSMTALHKGDLVKVMGTVTFRTWSRQDGTNVKEVELRVSKYEMEEPSGIAASVA
jgi:single stranded DNA-binding protein